MISQKPIFDFIVNRQSANKGELSLPIPSDEQIIECLKAAASAPDHGAIRPAKFYIVKDDGLEQLADLYEAEIKSSNPNASLDDISAARLKAKNAPMVIIIAAKVIPNHPKVPVIEQVVSASMAGYGFMLALEEAGFAYRLVTGKIAHDMPLRTKLGLNQEDRIIGLLQVGTRNLDNLVNIAGLPAKSKTRPAPENYLGKWQ